MEEIARKIAEMIANDVFNLTWQRINHFVPFIAAILGPYFPPASQTDFTNKENTLKPTIGRIVIFHFTDSEKNLNNQDTLAPAVITHVWSETCVNLKVFNDGEATLWKTSVSLGEQPHQWSWPERV